MARCCTFIGGAARIQEDVYKVRLLYINALDDIELHSCHLIRLFPQLSEGAALLSTTGDNDFMAYLKRLASSQGLRLNEFGLWRWMPNNGSVSKGQEGHWELVASKTEQEILNVLGLDYVEPKSRNFAFVINEGKEETLLKQPRSSP